MVGSHATAQHLRANGSVRWLLLLLAAFWGLSSLPAEAKPQPKKRAVAVVHSRTAHHAGKPTRQVRAAPPQRVQRAPAASLGVSRNAKPRMPEREIPMDGEAKRKPAQPVVKPVPAQRPTRAKAAPKRAQPATAKPRTLSQPKKGGRAVAAGAARAVLHGRATWYGPGLHNQLTANGERFDMHGFTAAHRSLPFGTKLRVVDERSKRSVVVRVNDRGPFRPDAVIDLSYAAAQQLGLDKAGISPVQLEVLTR